MTASPLWRLYLTAMRTTDDAEAILKGQEDRGPAQKGRVSPF
jgi:hypothetical protein